MIEPENVWATGARLRRFLRELLLFDLECSRDGPKSELNRGRHRVTQGHQGETRCGSQPAHPVIVRPLLPGVLFATTNSSSEVRDRLPAYRRRAMARERERAMQRVSMRIAPTYACTNRRRGPQRRRNTPECGTRWS